MIFIFLLALILFGPKKLPEIARQIGKFMAEFRRASNDFTTQLQSEIENAGSEAAPKLGSEQGSTSSLFNQQSAASFAQTLLPPTVKSAISEIDDAHDRLMRTARMAFDAQNFTTKPPDTPVVASADPASVATEADATAVTAAPPDSLPVEAVTDQPTHLPAPAKSDSAQQSS